MLSDRYGRKKVLISASISFIVLTVPAFALLGTGNFLVIVLVQILLGAMLTLNDGTLPSFLAEMFPTRVRYSGFAVSFNLSNALFGGTAPFMATLLIAATGNDLAPAWYLVAAAIVSLIAVASPGKPARNRCATIETQSALNFPSSKRCTIERHHQMTITIRERLVVAELERLKVLNNGEKVSLTFSDAEFERRLCRPAPDHGGEGAWTPSS